MRRLVLASFVCLGLLAGAASASATQPTGQIVFGMNQFCLTKGTSGRIPVDCGKGAIAIVNADGSGLRVLTHDKVTEISPRWSPDHRQIAYIRPTAHTSSRIWLMNADGSNQRGLTRLRKAPQLYGNDEEPSLDWSPSGKQIVFSAYTGGNGGKRELYLVSTRNGNESRLTYVSTGAADPVWSPDGRWIAFVGDIAPRQLYLLSMKTHKIHAIGHATGDNLAWSPEGKRLVFNGRGKLETVTLAGTRYHSLGVWGNQASWSPDGQWIVFTYGDYVKEIRPDGKGIRHILYVTSKKGWNFEPDW
jgi:TolB protein